MSLLAQRLRCYLIRNCSRFKSWHFRFQFLFHVNNLRTFQRRFNVAFRLIWRRDIAQRQSNVETTLCTSTLTFTTFNNIETTLRISTLNWTTLDNVETTLSFSTSISQRWTTSKQCCKYDHSIKPQFKSKIIFLSFKDYAGLKIFFNVPPF